MAKLRVLKKVGISTQAKKDAVERVLNRYSAVRFGEGYALSKKLMAQIELDKASNEHEGLSKDAERLRKEFLDLLSF